jgi:hypothetical protein
MRASNEDIPAGLARTYEGGRLPVGPRTEIRDSFVERVRRTRKRLRTTVRSPETSSQER